MGKNWCQIGANLINMDLIIRIQRTAPDQYTIYAGSFTVAGLTKASIQVILDYIGMDL